MHGTHTPQICMTTQVGKQLNTKLRAATEHLTRRNTLNMNIMLQKVQIMQTFRLSLSSQQMSVQIRINKMRSINDCHSLNYTQGKIIVCCPLIS